jgi:flagellar basal-body rod protein FlgB
MVNQISGALEKYMDLLAARQKLVAANVANADTPGYRTQDIDFQHEFQRAVDGGGGARAMEAPGLVARNDGNNVSLDRESRLLAENAMRFSVASTLVKSQLRSLRLAIQEGKNG